MELDHRRSLGENFNLSQTKKKNLYSVRSCDRSPNPADIDDDPAAHHVPDAKFQDSGIPFNQFPSPVIEIEETLCHP